MRKRLTSAFRRHGVAGIVKLLPLNIAHVLNQFGRRQRRQRRSLEEFDRRFGVDTAGFLSVSRLGMPVEVAAHAARYQPTSDLGAYLRALDISFAQYTFIDYGCGKGRVLLMASDYPFKQIIGVDCVPGLIEIARHNISVYRSASQLCHNFDLITCDAREFLPSPAPAVFFLYNPFGEVILSEVLARMSRIERAADHPDYLIYVDPRHRSCIEATGRWDIALDRQSWVVYRSGAPAALPPPADEPPLPK